MLSHVTFTGWDRHTDLDELAAFLEDCPQDRVEIAVLYSASRSANDDDRYPEVRKAVEILRAAKAAGQRSAVHLCGSAARELLTSATRKPTSVSFPTLIRPLIELADRVQVNVGEEHWNSSEMEKYEEAFIASEALRRPVMETRIRESFSTSKRRQDDPPPATYVSLTKCQRVMSMIGRWF